MASAQRDLAEEMERSRQRDENIRAQIYDNLDALESGRTGMFAHRFTPDQIARVPQIPEFSKGGRSNIIANALRIARGGRKGSAGGGGPALPLSVSIVPSPAANDVFAAPIASAVCPLRGAYKNPSVAHCRIPIIPGNARKFTTTNPKNFQFIVSERPITSHHLIVRHFSITDFKLYFENTKLPAVASRGGFDAPRAPSHGGYDDCWEQPAADRNGAQRAFAPVPDGADIAACPPLRSRRRSLTTAAERAGPSLW